MCGDNHVDKGNENGQPVNYRKNKGPIKNRSCTDIICCLLFLIFVVAMIAVSIAGYVRGNPKILVYPTDSDGNLCGYGDYNYTISLVNITPKSGLTQITQLNTQMIRTKVNTWDKPYLMYFDLLQCTKVGVAAIATGCPTPSVCVKSCPSTNWVYAVLEAKVYAHSYSSSDFDALLCKITSTVAQDRVNNIASKVKTELIDTDLCAPYYVKSSPLVGRCIPSIFVEGFDYVANLQVNDTIGGIQNLVNKDNTTITGNLLNEASKYLAKFYALKGYAELVFKDFINTWWLILACLGVCALFCFIWIVLLRWLAGIIVWLTFALFLACGIYGSYYCYIRYFDLKNNGIKDENYSVAPLFSGDFSYYLGLKKTWLAFACSSATVVAIFLLIFLFLIKRICIAIELIKEASRAISNMIFTLLWPIIPFILQIGFLAYYISSAVYVGSMGKAQYYNNGTPTSNSSLERTLCSIDSTTSKICQFVNYEGDKYTIPLEVFLLFMFFWCMNFIIALGQITLAGAFASYYWAFVKPDDIPAFPLTGALYRSLRYHLGSIAFGALLIAIVQIIRVLLEYVDHKLKGSQYKIAKFILMCLKCCMWCLEKFLRFLNKNAYILIAVYGKNFCASAKDAFFLIVRNVVRVVVLDKVTDFVLFISKLLCVAAVAIASYFFFHGDISYLSTYVPKLNYFFTPIILVVIGAYLIASCFFSVYSMAVDTLFLCFLEDLEMNDGSTEKPYYMSKGLMKIIGKKNTHLADQGMK